MKEAVKRSLRVGIVYAGIGPLTLWLFHYVMFSVIRVLQAEFAIVYWATAGILLSCAAMTTRLGWVTAHLATPGAVFAESFRIIPPSSFGWFVGWLAVSWGSQATWSLPIIRIAAVLGGIVSIVVGHVRMERRFKLYERQCSSSMSAPR